MRSRDQGPAAGSAAVSASPAVVELRVHGVGGASPAAMLGTTAFRQVWGDRIAGFYVAEGTRRDRTLEAYCWGGLTSRSCFRVLWVLLLPFMLANLAGWTCSARTRADRWAFAAHRACGRLAALAVTLNLLLIAAMVVVDTWAYQFGGQALPPSAPRWKAVVHALAAQPEPGRRVAIGVGVVAALLLGLAVLSHQARSRYEEVAPVGADGHAGVRGSAAALPDGIADPRFFDGAATVERLRRLHVSAGLAWLASLVAYAGGQRTLLAMAAVVLAAAIGLLACEAAGERLVTPLAAAALALVGTATVYAWHTSAVRGAVPGHLPGLRVAANVTFGLLFALIFAWLLVLPTIALLRALGIRHGAAAGAVEQPNRRWPGAPFVVATLSMLSVNTVGWGCLLAAAKSLGTLHWTGADAAAGGSGVRIEVFSVLREVTPWLTLAPIALALAFLLVELARWGAAGRRADRDAIVAEYAGRSDAGPPPQPPWDVWRRSALPAEDLPPAGRRRARRWVRSIARARKLAGLPADVQYLFTGMALIAVLVLGLAQALIWVLGGRMVTFGVEFAMTVAVLTPVGGLALLRWGWRRPDARRWLGVLWDVGTFWPRAYHPFAPPCYAERAVPDLQRRVRWLQDSGCRVLIVGHSQGSVLAAVALAQDGVLRPGRDRPVLVTFGAPLNTLYGWAFPAYVNGDLFDRLHGPGAPLRSWRNFSYRTDYIGGPIDRKGVDVPLPDPGTAWYVTGEPLPPIRSHTGYWSDEAMWQRIDELVAEGRAGVPATPVSVSEGR